MEEEHSHCRWRSLAPCRPAAPPAGSAGPPPPPCPSTAATAAATASGGGCVRRPARRRPDLSQRHGRSGGPRRLLLSDLARHPGGQLPARPGRAAAAVRFHDWVRRGVPHGAPRRLSAQLPRLSCGRHCVVFLLADRPGIISSLRPRQTPLPRASGCLVTMTLLPPALPRAHRSVRPVRMTQARG